MNIFSWPLTPPPNRPWFLALLFTLMAVGANAQTVDTTPYRVDFSPGSSIKRFSIQYNTADYSRVTSATNRLGQAMIASTVLDGYYVGEVNFYRVDANGNVYSTGRTEGLVFAPDYSISATGNLVLPASVTIGQTYSSSATFTEFITGLGPVTDTLESSGKIVGFETVTVPAGTFTALKIVFTEVWSGGYTEISTNWLVSGLGIVKFDFSDNEGDADGENLKHYVILNAQPQAQTVAAGASATLSVTATGGGGSSLTYQWRKDGVNVSGANASSYSITSAQASHAGSYTVVVSNTAGSVTSSAATLTVNGIPVVTSATTASATVGQAFFPQQTPGHTGFLSRTWLAPRQARLRTYTSVAI